MYPPALRGGLGGKGSFLAQGPKASKVSVKPFQRLAVSKGGAFGRPSQRAKHFSGGSIFLCFFLFAIEKERRKPSALHRGRHPGRGTAGLLVINGGKPFGAEKPDGPVPGGRTGWPSKISRWDVFESSEAKALGFVLAGERLLSGERPLWRKRHSPPRRGVPFCRVSVPVSRCATCIIPITDVFARLKPLKARTSV